MADCGATGSTIDRAAAAVVSGGNAVVASTSATKDMASFLGHASMSAGSKAMPLAPPVAIAMPATVATVPPRNTNNTMVHPPPPPTAVASGPMMNRVWQNHGHAPSAPLHPPLHQMMVPHPHQLQYQQQQQMHMQQAIHHQQQMQLQMMAQQQQQVNQLKQQNAKLKEAKEATQEQNVQEDGDALDSWHEGLEQEIESELDGEVAEQGHEGLVQGATVDELAEAWKSQLLEEQGHEGLARGATMEELAKAWAQAEAEYHAEEEATEHHSNLWNNGRQENGQPFLHSYEFSEASREHPTESVDWMARGMQQFQQGQTREAITSFETELRHVDGDNATAWLMLGRSHAENDQDQDAIACLEQAVDRDPYSTEALLALGVSYVNELNHERALENLKNWITHNPSYAGMEFTKTNENDDKISPQEEVQRLLQQALEFSHDANDAARVQEALGVVYNVSRDYDKAVEAFDKALEVHPDDNYQLYNKLGATLANSNQSGLALDAYHKALKIKPRYARAWLNMAISHSNLSNYNDAARCYLQTLSLNPSAVHCWSYLRIALSCSERWDLIPLAASQDLEAFREHYDFV